MVALPQWYTPRYPRPTLLLLPTPRREPVALLPAWTQTTLAEMAEQARIEAEDEEWATHCALFDMYMDDRAYFDEYAVQF